MLQDIQQILFQKEEVYILRRMFALKKKQFSKYPFPKNKAQSLVQPLQFLSTFSKLLYQSVSITCL